MTSSGIEVNDEVVMEYLKIKNGHTAKYITMKISQPASKDEKQEVIIDKIGGKNDTYDDFIAQLPQDEPRFGVLDFDYENKDKVQKSKLLFVNWCPDTAKVKPKMMQSATKDNVKRKLEGIANEVQATSMDEVSVEAFKEKCSDATHKK